MLSHALEINYITAGYDGNPAIVHAYCTFPAGVMAAIVGPNGAGKSTLIKTIVGIVKPIAGNILMYGKPISAQLNRIAYIPQKASVDWDFPVTVLDVALMGIYSQVGLLGRITKTYKQRAYEALRWVGMHEHISTPISALSGGQQQKVFLARALVSDALVYILDEPFNGVDHQSEQAIVAILKQLCTQGKTVVAVHHDLTTLTDYFDWVCYINKTVTDYGPVTTVVDASALLKNSRIDRHESIEV
ncbi:ABC transporter ATP-binding protein [Vermiphilus pyriformis]|nr:MAG: ABC transporter ATP-binding protein [Vermiphilus pyriformis]